MYFIYTFFLEVQTRYTSNVLFFWEVHIKYTWSILKVYLISSRDYDCLILKSFERMDVPANGWASRSNGWMFLTNGWVSRSNGWTFLSNGWASRSNRWMLLPNGWASHSNGWTFLSNGWSSRSNGCKFFWMDDPGRSNECKFLSNGFQTCSKRNSVQKRKAVIARFRVKGHSWVLSLWLCGLFSWEGYPREVWVELCLGFLRTLTLFKTKPVHGHCPSLFKTKDGLIYFMTLIRFVFHA